MRPGGASGLWEIMMIARSKAQHVCRSTARAVEASAAILCLVLLGNAFFVAATLGAAPPAPVASPVSVTEWAIGAAWYLVDVPHFANGDKSNDPRRAYVRRVTIVRRRVLGP